jgi:hypothetical protein
MSSVRGIFFKEFLCTHPISWRCSSFPVSDLCNCTATSNHIQTDGTTLYLRTSPSSVIFLHMRTQSVIRELKKFLSHIQLSTERHVKLGVLIGALGGHHINMRGEIITFTNSRLRLEIYLTFLYFPHKHIQMWISVKHVSTLLSRLKQKLI